MCRNIRPLFNFQPPTSRDEMRAAALQYVRKVSGFTRPSDANRPAFDAAVAAVEAATAQLLDSLTTRAAPRDREEDAQRRRARSLRRFATERTASPES